MEAAERKQSYLWSVRLILAGLVVELLSLFGLHRPLGFMLFASVGCTLLVAGIAMFLFKLLALGKPSASESPE